MYAKWLVGRAVVFRQFGDDLVNFCAASCRILLGYKLQHPPPYSTCTCLPITAPATNEASFPPFQSSSPPHPVNHFAISCLRSPNPTSSSLAARAHAAPFLLSLPLFSAVVAAARQSLRFFHLSAACDCERERSSYRQDHLPFCLGGHREETEVGGGGGGCRVGFPPWRLPDLLLPSSSSFLVNCAK